VEAAIEFQEEHDWAAVRERCHTLLAEADFGLEPLTDTFVQMRGYRIDHPNPAALQKQLYDEHRIEVPIVETPYGWAMPVSVQACNDEGDLRALRDDLKTV